MQFHLQAYLDTIYQQTNRKYDFTAIERGNAQQWQTDFRQALRACLKIANRELPLNPSAQLISSTDRDSYIEEKYALKAGDTTIPMYLLVPKSDPPYRAVMAFHGHATSVHHILGNHDDSETARLHRSNDENYAQRLAQDGYLVCTIEQQGFGERVTDQQQPSQSHTSCRHLAFEYLLHNRTLLGERVWDGMVAISYVLRRDDIVPDELVCVGFSGGGTTTLFLSALDERIARAIIAGYFCTFKKSILGVSHCECNYVPNLLTLGEAADIAGLIAPRPLRIISGQSDPIFPVDGVREQYERLQAIYRTFDDDANLSMSIHPDGHRPDYSAMVEWIRK